jgi:hypothetical protein
LWIDLRDPERITLYLVDGNRERVLVRHFTRHENPEVAREELGHVVELALAALRAGERIGVGREDARVQLVPAAAAPPVVVSPPPRPEARAVPALPPKPARLQVRAGAFVEGQAYGGGPELWTGLGVMGELRRKPEAARFGYGALLSGQYRFPARAEAGSTTMRFEGGAVHAMGVGTLAVSRPGEVALALGGGVDVLHAEALGDRAAEVRFADGHTRLVPTLRAVARYEHAIPSLRLFGGIGIDVPLSSTRYLLARQDGGTVVLFEAWGVRPFLVLGVQTP